MKKIIFLLSFVFIASSTFAQVETPQPSPTSKIEQVVGLTDVTVEYSRPGVKDRTIFGDLVPYGKLWRTGANKNTQITFSDDVKIGGKELKKGTYAIFSTPNKDNWEVVFYSDANNWGTPKKWDDTKVALKTTAKVSKIPMNVETFTIMFSDLKNGSANLNFIWADTEAMLTINVPTAEKANASIEKALSGPSGNDFYSAASFYYEEGKDLDKALTWITKAVELRGDEAFWMLRKKSLIEAKLGKKKEAIASAQKSLTSAEKAKNADYVKLNKDSLKEWGAM